MVCLSYNINLVSRNWSKLSGLKTIMTPIKSSSTIKSSRSNFINNITIDQSRETGKTYTLINAGAMMISPKLKTCLKNPEPSLSNYQLFDNPVSSINNVSNFFSKLFRILNLQELKQEILWKECSLVEILKIKDHIKVLKTSEELLKMNSQTYLQKEYF